MDRGRGRFQRRCPERSDAGGKAAAGAARREVPSRPACAPQRATGLTSRIQSVTSTASELPQPPEPPVPPLSEPAPGPSPSPQTANNPPLREIPPPPPEPPPIPAGQDKASR